MQNHIKQMLMELFLRATHCAKHFTRPFSSNPHNPTSELLLGVHPFYMGEKAETWKV